MTLFTERWHFTVAWLTWIALFFVIEAWAIFGKTGHATLSNHIRDFLDHQPTWVLACALALMLWLTAHFLLDLRD